MNAEYKVQEKKKYKVFVRVFGEAFLKWEKRSPLIFASVLG